MVSRWYRNNSSLGNNKLPQRKMRKKRLELGGRGEGGEGGVPAKEYLSLPSRRTPPYRQLSPGDTDIFRKSPLAAIVFEPTRVPQDIVPRPSAATER